jgi:hypothetical protein
LGLRSIRVDARSVAPRSGVVLERKMGRRGDGPSPSSVGSSGDVRS